MGNRLACVLAVGLLASLTATAEAQVIERLDAVVPALSACVQKQIGRRPVAGRREMTFRLAYRRDGTLIGLPRRTHSMPAADQPDQAQLLAEVGNAILACSPLLFSKELGEAIAGRTFTFRLIIQPGQDRRA
jgi:hypothetical protein